MSRSTVAFWKLQDGITECRKCTRLVEWRQHVARVKVKRFQDQEYWGRPIPAFGDPSGSLLIIGLAPAAHGANRTGRIFTGDRSGAWLYEALHRFGFSNKPFSAHTKDGLQLDGCIITAAVRCVPPANKPLQEELENCRQFLSDEMELLHLKRVVLTLGQIAFQSFLKVCPVSSSKAADKTKPKFCHGGEWYLDDGTVLLSSYHPSQQNTQTGRLTREMFHSVFRRAQKLLG